MAAPKKPATEKKPDTRNFFATMRSEVIASIKKAGIDDRRTASEILEEAAVEWLAKREKNKKA
ncbi:MAG: hypothetical protein JWL86_5332 [Rhizobium sp.]|nr:hypothetical protein [Rhizobium sp.]